MNLVEKLNPTNTALIVIDMQNDFCSNTGIMAKLGKNISQMDKLANDIQSLINLCTKKYIPIFYTQQIYDRSKLNDLQKEQYDLDGRMVTCDINSDGYKFYKLDPPSSQVYQKYNYNIFSNSQLISDLQTNNIKTLIITGVSTQICVETAIRNGFDIGYKIIVPSDLVSTTSNDPDNQVRTLKLVNKTFGVVTNKKELFDILANQK